MFLTERCDALEDEEIEVDENGVDPKPLHDRTTPRTERDHNSASSGSSSSSGGDASGSNPAHNSNNHPNSACSLSSPLWQYVLVLLLSAFTHRKWTLPSLCPYKMQVSANAQQSLGAAYRCGSVAGQHLSGTCMVKTKCLLGKYLVAGYNDGLVPFNTGPQSASSLPSLHLVSAWC